jgi:hypothetical protein
VCALILMSAGPICLYAIIWLGWIKSWYILLPLPGKFNSSAVYALLPIGLAFTMLLLSVCFPTPNPAELNIWLALFLALGGFGLVFIVWCPSWLKPPWVRWLEREYGYGLYILLEEARAMGRWRWEARVKSRYGLESWAREVLEKRGDDMFSAWEDWLTNHAIRKVRRQYWWKRRWWEVEETTEQYRLSLVPKHRERDYQFYIRETEKRLARRQERLEQEE